MKKLRDRGSGHIRQSSRSLDTGQKCGDCDLHVNLVSRKWDVLLTEDSIESIMGESPQLHCLSAKPDLLTETIRTTMLSKRSVLESVVGIVDISAELLFDCLVLWKDVFFVWSREST